MVARPLFYYLQSCWLKIHSTQIPPFFFYSNLNGFLFWETRLFPSQKLALKEQLQKSKKTSELARDMPQGVVGSGDSCTPRVSRSELGKKSVHFLSELSLKTIQTGLELTPGLQHGRGLPLLRKALRACLQRMPVPAKGKDCFGCCDP